MPPDRRFCSAPLVVRTASSGRHVPPAPPVLEERASDQNRLWWKPWAAMQNHPFWSHMPPEPSVLERVPGQHCPFWRPWAPEPPVLEPLAARTVGSGAPQPKPPTVEAMGRQDHPFWSHLPPEPSVLAHTPASTARSGNHRPPEPPALKPFAATMHDRNQLIGFVRSTAWWKYGEQNIDNTLIKHFKKTHRYFIHFLNTF